MLEVGGLILLCTEASRLGGPVARTDEGRLFTGGPGGTDGIRETGVDEGARLTGAGVVDRLRGFALCTGVAERRLVCAGVEERARLSGMGVTEDRPLGRI
jgi:hypothetical protein